MNVWKSAGLLVVLLSAANSAPSASAERFSSGYEVKFTDGGGDYSVQTVTHFTSGEPILQEFGRYRVSMLVTDVAGSDYSLVIKVQKKSSEANGLDLTVLEKSFSGELGGILEFESVNDLVKVSGAMAVSRLNQ